MNCLLYYSRTVQKIQLFSKGFLGKSACNPVLEAGRPIKNTGKGRRCRKMAKDLIEALWEACAGGTPGHASARLPLGGTGCQLHPVCESCPFDDCIAKETDILKYDRTLAAGRGGERE